jgi:predicted metalloprotease
MVAVGFSLIIVIVLVLVLLGRHSTAVTTTRMQSSNQPKQSNNLKQLTSNRCRLTTKANNKNRFGILATCGLG